MKWIIIKLKIKSYLQKHWGNALWSIFLIILTIGCTKACNKILPDEPIVIKEVLDTIKIIHKYDFNTTDDTIINSKLKLKLENIELAEKYDDRIRTKVKNNSPSPNRIMINSKSNKSKGYTIGDAAPYFALTISPLNGKYIDFQFEFINKEIIHQIHSLSLKIYKIDKDNKRIYMMDENYYIQKDINIIRINNTLTEGKYEIEAGFTFDKDRDSEYPAFYNIKRYLYI